MSAGTFSRDISLNSFPPVFWQADANKGEGLDLAAHRRRIVLMSARGVGNTAVSLGLSSSFPFIGPLIHQNTRCPTVIPDTHNLEHIAAFESEFVGGTGLVGPECSDSITRVNVVLRVVILEEWQLLRLLASHALWGRHSGARGRLWIRED